VLQRVELDGFQRGNQVIISWKMPRANAPVGNVQNISRADVYRLAEPLSNPLQLSEEEFSDRSTLIAALKITDADFNLKTLNYKDTLQFADQPVRLRYAIRFVNASGQKAGFSNAIVVEPASKIASNPTDLKVEASQDALRLSWTAPETNIDQTKPAAIIGYNIYRSNSATQPAKLLNKTPWQGTSYSDEFFEFNKDYWYFVRAVSAGVASEPVESAESNVVVFKAKDTFPPSAPSAITIAAAPGTISIFWAINPEKDVVGYRIYRSTDKDLPREQWTQLTTDLLKTNTYQDAKVESGKTYYYYLTATDNAGNVSPLSEVVNETAP
jgi:fibronectin type 3 domain-containing protein